MRGPKQVAKRALVATCLSFRASLEATEHPCSTSLSASILPWLTTHGLADELDPIEREILQTPYGQLRDDQIADANWSGEAAWVFAWAIGVVEQPPEIELVDYRILTQRLELLRTDPTRLIGGAVLRAESQLVEFCTNTVAIRTELQRQRVSDTPHQVFDQVLQARLERIGLSASDIAISSARDFVNNLTDEQRRAVAGLYFIRDFAATWLFDDRPTFFASASVS